MGTGRGNRQGQPPSGMGQRGEAGGEEQLILESFPEIPDITLKQRTDIGNILAKEQKDIFMQVRKKRELMEKDGQSPDRSEKEKDKMQKDIARIDGKIEKQIGKSNKKIRRILSDEQYQVFLEKRNDFKFKRLPPSGFRPPEERGGERPGRGENREFRR
jgi:hypothetical protein